VKVQRAPRASVQPQTPPVGFTRPAAVAAPAPSAVADAAAPSYGMFSAGVDLDVTVPLRRLGEPGIAAEVVATLVFACRHEGVVGGDTAIRVLWPTAACLVGVVLASGSDQSVEAVRAALAAEAADLPAPTADMLTIVHLGAARARPSGDWGLGGIGVATLGPVVPTIVSHRAPGDTSLVLAERLLVHLDLTVTDPGRHAHGAVRALDVLARAVEGPAR
jgi:hypothetical protein